MYLSYYLKTSVGSTSFGYCRIERFTKVDCWHLSYFFVDALTRVLICYRLSGPPFSFGLLTGLTVTQMTRNKRGNYKTQTGLPLITGPWLIDHICRFRDSLLRYKDRSPVTLPLGHSTSHNPSPHIKEKGKDQERNFNVTVHYNHHFRGYCRFSFG